MTALELIVKPIETDFRYRNQVYQSLKQAITSMNLYDSREELRLDERRLAHELGVSRTPIREALNRLEQEGFVRSFPRRGVFVVRKTKKELLEMITVWAALESMAARLITLNADDAEIANLRKLFVDFKGARAPRARIDEYSDANIRFHQSIVNMSRNQRLIDTMDNLFIHVRSIRRRTISEKDRAQQSIIDHMAIIEALERRQTERAEQLVRQHSLNLAAHVDKHVNYLD